MGLHQLVHQLGDEDVCDYQRSAAVSFLVVCRSQRELLNAKSPWVVMNSRYEAGPDKEKRFKMDPDAKKIRKTKVISTYSRTLNSCMMGALNPTPKQRSDAWALLREVEQAYAKPPFQDLEVFELDTNERTGLENGRTRSAGLLRNGRRIEGRLLASVSPDGRRGAIELRLEAMVQHVSK